MLLIGLLRRHVEGPDPLDDGEDRNRRGEEGEEGENLATVLVYCSV